MSLFIASANTKVFTTEDSDANGIQEKFQKFLRKHDGAEIIDWKLTAEKSYYMVVVIYKEKGDLDDILK
jgi:hypothetical protein